MSGAGSTEPPGGGYEALSIDDLDQFESNDGTLVLSPLRRRLGFRPFGVNVWVARTAGDRVIEEHRERDGPEELYVVLRGDARFTLGDEEFDAPVGTLVYAPPGTLRGAVALADDTRVLAAGARAGEVFTPSGWEDFYVAFAHLRAGNEPAGRAVVHEALARDPDAWQGNYNAACFEALAGNADAALAQLRTAVERNPEAVKPYLATDTDLDGLRADPRFAELEPSEGGSTESPSSEVPVSPAPQREPSHAHVDELDAIEMPAGFVWRPVRRRFDIRGFGVNAYTAREAGGQIVEEHTEQTLGHEEIYLVVRGRARFAVAGDELELGAGQLVFVSDPRLRRGAVALTGDAVVLALGGKPGAPHQVSAWEAMFAAVPAANAENWDEAIRIHEEALAETPDSPALLYNLACLEARGGRHLDALLHLQHAVELDPQWAGHARTDSDFAAIRDEPGFPAA